MPEGLTEEELQAALAAIANEQNTSAAIGEMNELIGNATPETVSEPVEIQPVAVEDGVANTTPDTVNVPVYEDVYSDSSIDPNNSSEEVVEESTIENNDSLAVGDVVTLSPDIAEKIANYDPDDEYRVVNIENGLVDLSRNGEVDDNLTYIPVENLTKYNYVDSTVDNVENNNISEETVQAVEPVVVESESKEETVPETELVVVEAKEEKKPIIEKGSKPIRWSKRFIEKVKKNNTIAGISQNLEESKEKDQKETEELNSVGIEGKVVSFTTKYYEKKLTLVQAASSKWTKIKGWFKKDKKEEAEEAQVVEPTVQTEEQAEKTKDAVKPIVEDVDSYKKFLEIPDDKRAEVFNEIVKMLSEMQQELKAEQQHNAEVDKKVEEAKQAIEQATETIKQQNDKIAELTAGKENITTEPEQTTVEQEEVVTEPEQTKVEQEEVVTEPEQTTVEQGEVVTEPEQTTVEQGEVTVDPIQKTSTFTAEEVAAENERRRNQDYSYDRDKQADYEMFWQNQAAYTQSPEYQRAAFERATEDIERKKEEYEKSTIGQTPEEKAEWNAAREALAEKSRIEAQRNKFMTNVHYGTYTDEQIANMLAAVEEDKPKAK